jgi:hypothetical protein
MSRPAHFAVRQEEDDIASPKIARVALLAIAIGLLAVFFSSLLLEKSAGGILSSPAAHGAAPAAGREIANIEQTPILSARDGLDLRDQQLEQLSRYEWVDRDAGVVAIPIDEAIDLVVKEQQP